MPMQNSPWPGAFSCNSFISIVFVSTFFSLQRNWNWWRDHVSAFICLKLQQSLWFLAKTFICFPYCRPVLKERILVVKYFSLCLLNIHLLGSPILLISKLNQTWKSPRGFSIKQSSIGKRLDAIMAGPTLAMSVRVNILSSASNTRPSASQRSDALLLKASCYCGRTDWKLSMKMRTDWK